MKKILIIGFMLMVTLFGLSAQKTIDQMNGYDWVTLNSDRQAGIIQGYYLACNMMIVMTYELSQNSMNKPQLDELWSQLCTKFLYEDSVGQMINKLNEYYASPDKRKYLIYRTIPFIVGREWWNRQTGKVESYAPMQDG